MLLLLAMAFLQAPEPPRDLARAVLKELIEINTTDSSGDNTAAAQAIAQRFREAGFPASDVEVVVPAPKKGNVVVRYRGAGKGRPVLFIAHLDVVEARREDWTMDPFQLHETDGYFYGRGTQDMKGEAALLVANFIRLKREAFQPDRDLILALTADEEGGRGPNGVQWLLHNRHALIDAEYCLNMDSVGGQAKDGRRILYSAQAAEKGYLSFYLRAKNPGGHSSLPVRDNAIYAMSEALLKVRELQFPENLNEVTRNFFAKSPEKSANPAYENALRRTTCVATMLQAGHADNALPQSAEATVNCRVMPGETQVEVERRLREAVGNGIEISVKIPLAPNLPSPLTPARSIDFNHCGSWWNEGQSGIAWFGRAQLCLTRVV
ncbi:MAG: M20/M25/M40 family metallo-hydrolase [Bryobacteraceae bacterium]|jgi:acetylornithine deacetylase/succinyl-diaminopimelate desuccinylase-like protein